MQCSAVISLTVVNLLRKIWYFMLLSKIALFFFFFEYSDTRTVSLLIS